MCCNILGFKEDSFPNKDPYFVEHDAILQKESLQAVLLSPF